MEAKPLIYLAFANDSTQLLENLEEEDRTLHSLLLSGEQRDFYYLKHTQYTNIDDITTVLSTFKDQVIIFHYGGHANSKAIFLKNETAHAVGVAEMLSQQRNLKLVFLNGCSTQAQVNYLLDLGVPAVIATSRSVSDRLATKFAEKFYDALVNRHSLKEAFDFASSFVRTRQERVTCHRGIRLDKIVGVETWILNVAKDDNYNFKLPSSSFAGAKKQQELLNWPDFFKKESLLPKGRIMTVDCDRKHHYSSKEINNSGMHADFSHHYKHSQHIVFFLSACPYQRPTSLAKRLVYDFLEDLPVRYTKEQSPWQHIDEEVKALDLEIKAEPDLTWGNIWRKIQAQFSSNADSSAALLVQNSSYKFIALIFRVSEIQWEASDLEDHLVCLLNQFKDAPATACKYLLFFSFEFAAVHGERSAQCEDRLIKIEELKHKFQDSFAIFHKQKLPAVEEADIERWYENIAQRPKRSTLQNLISTLRNFIEEDTRLRSDIDMAYVEEMQEAAYNYGVRPNHEQF